MKPPELAHYRGLPREIKARVRQARHRAAFSAKPIGVAEYELIRALPRELASSLPSIEDLEIELSEDLKEGAQ